MEVTYDKAKRRQTLDERGLDFADAGKLLDGVRFTQIDDRFDYPEPRYQTYGRIDERLVMMAWTPTPNGIRVISTRKCNDREQQAFADRLA